MTDMRSLLNIITEAAKTKKKPAVFSIDMDALLDQVRKTCSALSHINDYRFQMSKEWSDEILAAAKEHAEKDYQAALKHAEEGETVQRQSINDYIAFYAQKMLYPDLSTNRRELDYMVDEYQERHFDPYVYSDYIESSHFLASIAAQEVLNNTLISFELHPTDFSEYPRILAACNCVAHEWERSINTEEKEQPRWCYPLVQALEKLFPVMILLLKAARG